MLVFIYCFNVIELKMKFNRYLAPPHLCAAMVEDIELNRAALDALCRRFCVRRLELFGSAAATGRFDPASSDFDFLVEFDPHCPMGLFHQFIDFQLALQDLFGRNVDLVEQSAIRNPYFRQAVDRAPRAVLYAA
jgi:predicted nucleotidyltransferase